MIRVIVVDDHELVRNGICRMLSDLPDIEVVGEAESGDEAIKQARLLKPEVILLDVNMPNIGGVEAAKRLLQIDKSLKIIAVSSLTQQPYPSMLLKAGVRGYLTKGAPLSDMHKAILKVQGGGRFFSPEVSEHTCFEQHRGAATDLSFHHHAAPCFTNKTRFGDFNIKHVVTNQVAGVGEQ